MTDDALRARVHLAESLPAGTWALGFAPTFRAPRGLRVRGTKIELWTEDAVERVTTDAFAELSARAHALPLSSAAPQGGRDGLLLLVRTELEAARSSTSDETGSDWLALAVEALTVLEPLTHGPRRTSLAQLRRYFP